MNNISFVLVIGAILFFLPAAIANMMPVIFGKLIKNNKIFYKRIDGGLQLGGSDLFGKSKTWGGLFLGVIGGALGSILVYVLINQFNLFNYLNLLGYESVNIMRIEMVLVFGMIIGFGALIGDLIGSFLKRRLKIKSGDPFPVVDQVDYIVGASLFICLATFLSSVFYNNIGINILDFFKNVFYITIVACLILGPVHLLVNIIAYKIGLKKVWW